MAILSKIFVPPPQNAQMNSIFEPIVHHVKHNPDYPLFQYADAQNMLHRVSWTQIANCIQSVARLVGKNCDASWSSSEPYVIGILANLDSISYFCLIFGIILAGCVPFPISLRNSPEGVAHLLSATNCRSLFISEDPATKDLCDASFGIFDSRSIPVYAVPGLTSLLEPPKDGSLSVELQAANIRSQDLCIIYHSSGSTGHPKPIYLSHEFVVKWSIGTAYRDPGVDTTAEVVSIHGLPFYHAMAQVITLSGIMGGTIVSVFDPAQDSISRSPESVLAAAVSSRSNKMLTIPSFIETWSKSREHVETMKSFTSIVYAGAPITHEIGEELFQAGVNISSTYGTTETGSLAVFSRADVRSEGWNWLKMPPGLDIAYIPVEDGLYKLVIKENEYRKLAVSNSTVDGVPAYDTNDVVERHPTNPALCRVKNRQDTLIVHSSGEKTNPIPIEEHLHQDERIAAAVMFGREKPLAGVLILPAAGYSVDTQDSMSVQKYREMIWMTILDANEKAPAHSRILKEMVLIADSRRPFEYTEKGIPKRHSILKEYHDDIQKVYVDAESGIVNSDCDLSISDGSDLDVATQLVRTVFQLALSKKVKGAIGENDDIFLYGADSLCAISIRNSILRVLGSKLPYSERENARSLLKADLVFAYPTISSLSLMISQLPFWGIVKNLYLSRKKEREIDADPDLPDWNAYLSNLRAPSGLVKFKDGKGDIPIILIPDVAGSAGIFIASHHLYESAVWACDTTHMAPDAFTSMQALVSFYLNQILGERPRGPYRFASYSGSCVALQCIVKHLEEAGHEVVQVAFLDHYPDHYLRNVDDPPTFNPSTSNVQHDYYVRNSFRYIHKMWTSSSDNLEVIAWLIKAYEAVIEDKPINSKVEHIMKRMWNTTSITIKFLFGDKFRVEGEWSRDLYEAWLKSMNVVPTVYLTAKGIAAFCEYPEKEFATGLGVTRAYPDARVVVVPGGHADVLIDKVAISDQEIAFV